MRKTIEFSIPVPCHENWDNMTPNEQGKFCSSCQKSVVDFTEMSDEELIRYFRNKKKETCGRFRDDQLDRQISAEAKTKIHWFKYLLQLLIPTLFFTSKSFAQGKVKTTNIDHKAKTSVEYVQTKPIIMGDYAPTALPLERKIEKKVLTIQQTLTGKVIDQNGNVIEGASVMLQGTTIGISTIKDGTFSLPVKKEFPLTLAVSYVGYEPVNVEFTREMANSPVEVILSESKIMNEIVVIGYGITRRRAMMGSVCISGTYVTSSKKVNEAVEKKVEMKLYPNPIRLSSNLTVEYPSAKNGKYTIEIFDINGKLLQMEQVVSSYPTTHKEIQLKPSVVAGTYVVHVVDPVGKRIANEKIIVLN